MAGADLDSTITSPNWLTRHRRLLLIIGPLLIFLVVALLFIRGGRYMTTDDAYIQAARTDISSNLAGRITRILVHENQQVHQGDMLFTLDDRDLKIAIQSARAQLATAKMQIGALKATYRQNQSDVQAAQQTVAYLKTEYNRQKNLAAQGISSQIQLEQAHHAFVNAEQQVNASNQQLANARANLNNNPDINVNAHPSVQQAQAELDRALLNLSYTVVKSPVDGIVAKVDQLQVGNYITAATPLFAVMSKNIWVQANFKETELTHMRPDQPATFEVDTYPGHVFHGRVMSFSPGTGSSFALLPPENATGNWVKVVQRLPVRISIDDADPKIPLHAGLSVNVKIDTHYSRLQGLTHG
ncbi:MAG: HlyD family secretion protein [Moraxellaceae bacterium]|nr:MAG: HlyD family secretion protein [Moraxellaceae bacterium]